MLKVERELPHKLKNFKFLKKHRLLKSDQFSAVFNERKVIRNQYLSIFLKNNELEYPRLGFAISKKSVKLAVNRNKIKRVIREEFRNNKGLLPKVDIVIVTKDKINELSINDLREMLRKQWEKI